MSEFDDLKKLEMALAQRDALVKALEEIAAYRGEDDVDSLDDICDLADAALALIRSTK